MSHPYSITSGRVHFETSAERLVPVGSSGEEFAICFDAVSGCLQKHGPAGGVEAWQKQAIGRLLDGGYAEMADGLTMIRFPINEKTLPELNACIEISGRAQHFADNLAQIAETHAAPAAKV